MDWKGYSTKPDSFNLQNYPTILDVLEDITEYENANTKLSRFPLSKNKTWLYKIEEPGHYLVAGSEDDWQIGELIPTGRCPFTFYRGESKSYPSCTPSLLRINEEKDVLKAYLQSAELEYILKQHPVIRDLLYRGINHPQLPKPFKLKVQFDGLAQHYGIKTQFLDLTNNKLVAAFFAITNYVNGSYEVVVPSTSQQFGKIYRLNKFDPFNNNLPQPHPIGMQYFNRPGRQSAFTLDMSQKKDFNLYPNVEHIYFRHDAYSNKLVFDLCQQGRRFFPEDSLVEIVEKLKEGNGFSNAAVEKVRIKYYTSISPEEMCAYVEQKGLQILPTPATGFDRQLMEDEWNTWVKEGAKRYLKELIVKPFIKEI